MPSVLIIEDDPDMQTLERMALESEGYDVTAVSNGSEGLQRLETARPCVIVLDLMMPVMDGLMFLTIRRRYGLGADIPVICLSAAGPALMEEAHRLGADACMHKPTDFDELCGLVEKYCGE